MLQDRSKDRQLSKSPSPAQRLHDFRLDGKQGCQVWKKPSIILENDGFSPQRCTRYFVHAFVSMFLCAYFCWDWNPSIIWRPKAFLYVPMLFKELQCRNPHDAVHSAAARLALGRERANVGRDMLKTARVRRCNVVCCVARTWDSWGWQPQGDIGGVFRTSYFRGTGLAIS